MAGIGIFWREPERIERRSRLVGAGNVYMGESRNWEDIARELSRETDPRLRRKLERDLGPALERAGFQKLSRQAPFPENEDDQVEKG